MICRVESSLVERSEVKGRERREGKFEEFERERQKKSSSSTSPINHGHLSNHLQAQKVSPTLSPSFVSNSILEETNL